MTFQTVIFLIIFRISFLQACVPKGTQLQATEIQCETDLKNPVTFGSDVTVTCTSKVQEIRGLAIIRPKSTTLRFHFLPPNERLQAKSHSSHSYVFVILNTTFQDSGNWELDIATTDGINSKVKEVPLDLEIVKHPSRVHFEDTRNPIIVNLGHESEQTIALGCIAEDTYPEPTFEWFLDDQQLDLATKNHKIEEIENETFKSSIDITVKRTKEKDVTCQVYHSLQQKMNVSTVIDPHFYPYDVQPTKFYSLKPNCSNQIEFRFQASHQSENVALIYGKETVNLTINNVTKIQGFNFKLALGFVFDYEWIGKEGQLKIGKSSIGITLYDLSEEELYTRANFKKTMIGVGVVIGFILCVMLYIFTVRHRGSGLISTSSKIVFWYKNRFSTDID